MIWAFHFHTDSYEDMLAYVHIFFYTFYNFFFSLWLMLGNWYFYSQCAKVTMPELTLARFILEFSLMSYDMITVRDSKVGAAALFMALRMNDKTGWNKTLEYYSGK